MKYEEYAFHASEVNLLESLLEKTPMNMTVERLGIEHRLAKAKERIEGVPIPPAPQKAYVSFRVNRSTRNPVSTPTSVPAP